MGLAETMVGSLVIAAVSTTGDFIWPTWVPAHLAVYGFAHAAVLFLAIGLFLGAVASRGAIAAVASGLGFYAISGIWRPFNPQGWDYAVHFGAWTVAYFPGFAALLIARPRSV